MAVTTWIYFQPALALWLLFLAGLTYFRPIYGIALLFVILSLETVSPVFGIFITFPEFEFAACLLAWTATQKNWTFDWRPMLWGAPFLAIVTLSGFANIAFYKIPPHLLRISELFVMSFLILNLTKAPKDRKILSLATAAAAALYSGYGLYQFMEQPCEHIYSFLGNPNQFAGYLNWVLPFFLAFFFFNRPIRSRALWFYLALLVFITLVLTFSRGGLIAGTSASFCLVFLSLCLRQKQQIDLSLRQTVTITASAVLMLASAGTAFAVQPFGQQVYDCLRGRTSARWGAKVTSAEFLGSRPSYYRVGLDLWMENFWVGVGPGNFKEAIEEYYSREKLGDPDPYIRVHAHNIIVDLAIQYGTLGPITFLLFLVALFRDLFCRRSNSPYALAGIGLVVAFFIHNMVDVSFPSTALEMGFLIGLAIHHLPQDE